jgi:hypothetical protein
VGQLVDRGLLPCLRTLDGHRIFRRDQVQVITNARRLRQRCRVPTPADRCCIRPVESECIRTTVFHREPFRTITDIEFATASWP